VFGVVHNTDNDTSAIRDPYAMERHASTASSIPGTLEYLDPSPVESPGELLDDRDLHNGLDSPDKEGAISPKLLPGTAAGSVGLSGSASPASGRPGAVYWCMCSHDFPTSQYPKLDFIED
jgi:hypothetical protein